MRAPLQKRFDLNPKIPPPASWMLSVPAASWMTSKAVR